MRNGLLWESLEALLIPADSFTEVRREARQFLRQCKAESRYHSRSDNWHIGFSPEFTKLLAGRGWIGMTWPTEFGGRAAAAGERLAVIEELLGAGAPLAAHWVGDRQVGPTILKFGTVEQAHRFLPAMANGECYFALGMSEPDAGSDLASVRTFARKQEDGTWVLNGSKIWSSHAHRCDYMVVLCRTDSTVSSKHEGLSQLIVPLRSEGVQVSPIRSTGGHKHFAEVSFTNVHLDNDALLGTDGDGWTQVRAELAYERSGPERYLSTWPLIAAMLTESPGSDRNRTAAVQYLARIQSLRSLSRAVGHLMDSGKPPEVLACVVKDIGTSLESDSVFAFEAAKADAGDNDMDASEELKNLARLFPSFTLRGGTNEVLRTVLARGIYE
ncbi:acyl-CoA dehydrogenase family protein [Ornithinimicrobium cryptoxanthini]|uniref:acyl-CoA dehydrogenase family protein n=1 Tax=Ornithinimicrobium cryptoxanthini TaxID=2934161 RepID=UPI00351C0D6B